MEEKDYYLFNNDEEFKLLIGDSFAYKNMQNAVSKLVSFIKPNYLIEFGSGSGSTSIRLGKENPNTSIVAVDVREKMIGLSQDKINTGRIKNVTFVNADLLGLDHFNLKNCNLVLLMYSFKYISDPLENKLNFLKGVYERMQENAVIIIGDTFILENAKKQEITKQFENIYSSSALDAFWENLISLDEANIINSINIENQIKNTTSLQVKYATERDGVYCVSTAWLSENAKQIGFKVLINKNLNSLGDAIIVLQK